MLYFAYGSNLSLAKFLDRVPSAELVTTAYLLKHRLYFHKAGVDGSAKCDAFETGDDSHSVLGAIYRLSSDHKEILGLSEGVGKGCEEKMVSLFSRSGDTIEAFTYYATDIDTNLKPFHWYKGHVLIGAREHDFPEEYIGRFLSVESIDDPDLERAERELAIHGLGVNDRLRGHHYKIKRNRKG